MEYAIPLQMQAYGVLKERILAEEFEDGVIYSITQVAKDLGISRTPVKDAITRLSKEMYVDIIPSKGFQLHQLSKSDITNTYQIRTAFECYAAYDLCASRSDRAREKIQQLKDIVDNMELAVRAGRPLKELLELDSDFHSVLVTFLNNPEIESLFSSYLYSLRTIAAKTFAQEGRTREACVEHRQIIQAIESGQANEAFESVRFHLNITNYLANKYY